jgi:hypothetical protein
MSTFVAVGLLGAVLASAITGSAVTWIAMRLNHEHHERQRLAGEVAKLAEEVARLSRSKRQWLDEVKLDARTGMLNAVTLWELSVRDGLDALNRLSPERAWRVVDEVLKKK